MRGVILETRPMSKGASYINNFYISGSSISATLSGVADWYGEGLNLNMRLGRFESAKADIDRALALEPKFPAAYLNYAAYYLYERHNSAQALKSIELAVRNGLRGTQQLEDENGAGYFLKKFAGRASVRRVLRGGRR